MRNYEKTDGTELSNDSEWIKCRECKTYASSKCTGINRIQTGKQIIRQKIYSLPKNWVGTLEDALCPKCWEDYNKVKEYQEQWQMIEKARIRKLKEATKEC